MVASNSVSVADRYQLALQAGFSQSSAGIITAISSLENGGGIPTLNSAPNRNGSFDIGLWQINSGHLGELAKLGIGNGTVAGLQDPLTNAKAAFYISGGGTNFFPWCTYPGGCGGAANVPNQISPAGFQSLLAKIMGEIGSTITPPIGGGTTDIPAPNPTIGSQPTTTTNTTTGVQGQTQATTSGSGPPLNLNFAGSLQHVGFQFLLVLIAIAILLGGIYLLGSGHH